MSKWFSTQAMARQSARRPWLAVALWLVVIAGAMVAASGLGDVLTAEQTVSTSTESGRALALVEEHLHADEPAREFVIVEVTDPTRLDATVADLVTSLVAVDTVIETASHLQGAPGMVSPDGTTALVQMVLNAANDDAVEAARPVVEVITAASKADGVRVTTIGGGSINMEFERLAEETLMRGEMIGIGVALIILLVVFGAAVAAGLPLVLAIASVIAALGITALVGRAIELSTFVTNIITMIGLAVGIDYSLLIVQRFREERARGVEKLEAIARTGATASQAVFFSGIAVIIALTGLLVMPDPMFRSLGLGAIFVVIAAVFAALTLLPAMLSILGDRVNRFSLPGRRAGNPDEQSGIWTWMTRAVTARPVVSVVLSAGLLIGIGAFTIGMDLGTNGISSLPEDSAPRHAYETLNETFTGGATYTDVVVTAADVQAPAVQQAVAQMVAALEGDGFYGEVSLEANPDGTLALVRAATLADFASTESREALERLRGEYVPEIFAGVPAEVAVGGDTAVVTDSVAQTVRYMPIVFTFVLALSFLLLTIAFRSIVIPVTAVLMNLLSLAAAYGAMVLVFQRGFGADLLGFQQVPIIEAWLPLFLFSILFGLSMDYHVFLLSRMKERYDQTGNNAVAVEHGLRRTGAIITGAAGIMVAVFGGFAVGDLATFQQMGFGLAVSVILDATVVRCVLVPATMELLGDRNWYFPRWLEWLPRVDIEGSHQAEPAAPAPILRSTGVAVGSADAGH